MKIIKRIIFLALLASLVGIIFIFACERCQPPFSRTLSPLFQELGKSVHSVDRAISTLMPIDEIDEKKLGEAIKARIMRFYPPKEVDEEIRRYLNDLVRDLTRGSRRGFEYTVFLFDGSPNAFAMPGGVIGITKPLLELLSNEAELVAILGHEIGHIERGHLFDLMRGTMLRRKFKNIPLDNYAAEVIKFFGNVLFSKSVEDEADEYGFRLLLEKNYNPFAMSDSFEKFLKFDSKKRNVLNDFFSTHPHMVLRQKKFHLQAENWLNQHLSERVYIGRRNLRKYTARCCLAYDEEYEVVENLSLQDQKSPYTIYQK